MSEKPSRLDGLTKQPVIDLEGEQSLPMGRHAFPTRRFPQTPSSAASERLRGSYSFFINIYKEARQQIKNVAPKR
jgi:hypothetical protein